jgi:hypothetical protein
LRPEHFDILKQLPLYNKHLLKGYEIYVAKDRLKSLLEIVKNNFSWIEKEVKKQNPDEIKVDDSKQSMITALLEMLMSDEALVDDNGETSFSHVIVEAFEAMFKLSDHFTPSDIYPEL